MTANYFHIMSGEPEETPAQKYGDRNCEQSELLIYAARQLSCRRLDLGRGHIFRLVPVAEETSLFSDYRL